MKRHLRLVLLFAAAAFLMLSLNSCPKVEPDEPGIPESPTESSPTISLNKSDLQLEIGQSEELIAIFEPATENNQAHTWKSSDPTIASVDQQGTVKGLNFGKCRIIATALNGGRTAACEVEVIKHIIHVENVALNKTRISMAVGEKQTLVATVIPQNASNTRVRWTSDNEAVATVDGGEVTAWSVGTAEISVVSEDGQKYAQCVVEVMEKTVTFANLEVSNITSSSVQVKAEIVPVGLEIKECGICYSNSAYPTIDNSRKESQTNSISMALNNLEPYTKYYFRAYAVVSDDKVYYSKNQNFTTNAALITNFRVKEVYDDKYNEPDSDDETRIILTSPAIKGYDNVTVCYGSEPEPTITDNVATAYLSSESGELELTILEKTDVMYVRSYQKNGSSIIYTDDEVEIRTNNVEISYSWNGSGGYTAYNKFGILINYTIHQVGIYEVSSIYGYGRVFKERTEESPFYLTEGTGTFSFKGKGSAESKNSYLPYLGKFVSFILGTRTLISIKNIETNEAYIFITPDMYIYDYNP